MTDATTTPPETNSWSFLPLHRTIARVFISLAGILVGHIWSWSVVMVIGVLFAAAESTRLATYVTRPTGADLCIDSVWVSFSLLWISLLCQYFDWPRAAIAFVAITAGVLASVFTTAVTRKDGKFVAVERVTL